ncbi:hypothetical protein DN062_08310 [Nitrincola tibetensis]|uniref:Uncharacterized protein n=1 Tax=Nitrincola tibetensis TaxID=2219697 RepID=A0A364NMK8_9GAMM|nr:hypothetical protein DN062_08310 [Nitrincola tibetensis]
MATKILMPTYTSLIMMIMCCVENTQLQIRLKRRLQKVSISRGCAYSHIRNLMKVLLMSFSVCSIAMACGVSQATTKVKALWMLCSK